MEHCVWTSPECTQPSSDRKVAAYLPFVMGMDGVGDHRDADGHGTHCAGSVAGSANGAVPGAGEMNEYQGMAPGARLVLIDLMGTNKHLDGHSGVRRAVGIEFQEGVCSWFFLQGSYFNLPPSVGFAVNGVSAMV